jgi:hypothetical protein
LHSFFRSTERERRSISADAGDLNSKESGKGCVPRCDICRSHGASRSAAASAGETPGGGFVGTRAMSRVRRGLRLYPVAVGSTEWQTIKAAPFSGNGTGIGGYPGVARVRNPQFRSEYDDLDLPSPLLARQRAELGLSAGARDGGRSAGCVSTTSEAASSRSEGFDQARRSQARRQYRMFKSSRIPVQTA